MFPITIISFKVIGNFILLLLSIFGIYRIITERINPFKLKPLKYITYLSLSYFLVMLLSIILSSGFGEELRHIFRKLHFLFLPALAVAFYGLKMDFDKLIKLLKFYVLTLSIFLFGLSLYDNFVIHSHIPFEVGHLLKPPIWINSNVFGDIFVVLVFISISKIFYEERGDFILSVISFFMGSMGLFLIQSRGSWIAFLLLMILFTIFVFKKYFVDRIIRRRISVLLLLILSVALLYMPYLSHTVDKTLNNIEEVNVQSQAYSSGGVRLQMWQASLDAFRSMPWHGYGYRLANERVAEFSKYNKENIASFTHLHNEYITNIMSAGFIGLFLMLAMIFWPMLLFYRARKKDHLYKYAIAGILITSAYTLFGLFHIALGEEHLNAVYIFFMAYLIPIVYEYQEQP